MYNIRRCFDKILNVITDVLGDSLPAGGNYLRPGLKPTFTDIEVIALSLTAESLSIDSESRLFAILNYDYRDKFPNLISRRQFNDRRKTLFPIQQQIRARMADQMNSLNEVLAVDSMPLEICKLARMERNKMGRDGVYYAPQKGYCAAQDKWYYGYKMHCACSPSGVIQTFDLSGAAVHDVNYLRDLKNEVSDCILTGDRGYISKSLKQELWEDSRIAVEVPYRNNQKEKTPICYPLKVIRKRIETVFSQLCDMFSIQRNYAKSFIGYRTRILAKISSLTILQYINKFITGKPVGRVKYALAC